MLCKRLERVTVSITAVPSVVVSDDAVPSSLLLGVRLANKQIPSAWTTQMKVRTRLLSETTFM